MSFQRAKVSVLAGVGVILIALLFDASPLFVPGVAFVLLGVLLPLWVWFSARGASVERCLEQEHVIEGEPLESLLELRGGRFGLPGGELRDLLAGSPVRLPRGRTATVRVLAKFDRRGRRHLPPPSLVIRDPLELAECTCPSTGVAQDVLVLPRTEPVHWTQPGGGAALSAASRVRAELLAAVEVDGLRPYRPGTSASRIHWPALARGAGLLERRLRVDGDTKPLVVLDASGTPAEEQLDAAVRAAASLTLELARARGCRLLLPGIRRALAVESDLTSWPGAHARLAMVEGGPAARAPAPAGIRASLGPLFYVTAQQIDKLPSALGREAGSASAAMLVLPAALAPAGLGRPSFAVSGCVGFKLGAVRSNGSPASPNPTAERAA